MIENVLQHQVDVFDEMVVTFQRQLKDSDSLKAQLAEDMLNQVTYDRTVGILRRRWRKLDEDAERVEESVRRQTFRGWLISQLLTI